jgi:lipoprotein NlpI
MRIHAFDSVAFSKDVDQLDIRGWPMPILDFYRGASTVEKIYRKAANDEETVQAQKCEADFYFGEWQFGHGDITAAKDLLTLVADSTCPAYFVEPRLAKDELQHLSLP